MIFEKLANKPQGLSDNNRQQTLVDKNMTCFKRFFTAFIAVLTLIYTEAEVHAQVTSVDATLAKAFATDELLPFLIDAALKNSGEVKKFDKSIQLAQANLKINKNSIFSVFGLQASYAYGTNYAAVADATASTNFNRLTTTQTGFYNLGAGISLPLTTIINRKHLVKSAQMQMEVFGHEKENATLALKLEVIRMYQELKLSQKLLAISSNNKQSAQLNYDLAEKEFVQGQLTVEQLSKVLEMNNKAKIEYEQTINLFQTNILQLETFTGTTLASLLKRVR
ncbi:TolC family protein [Emticicia sp. BO119]|uniref:TolC family protein n=1 Tax=Emticicia sp. BO119 TaxID=2757768 RepID=UPI0015F122A5|nr:TolC family protein [Emticicia sp. BO119]MBA4852676.1 TolC family protein [Emticicia sp. BO119]